MIRNTWLDEVSYPLHLKNWYSKRQILQDMRLNHLLEDALVIYRLTENPNVVKGKFQEASTKSLPGRMYPRAALKDLVRDNEISD